MSVRQVATMTFYFTRRLVVLPFHPQNVTRDPVALCDEKLTKMSYLRLEVPTARYRPSRCRFAFFELTTLQTGFIFRRGCIRFAKVCRRHDAPCIRKETENKWYEKRSFRYVPPRWTRQTVDHVLICEKCRFQD